MPASMRGNEVHTGRFFNSAAGALMPIRYSESPLANTQAAGRVESVARNRVAVRKSRPRLQPFRPAGRRRRTGPKRQAGRGLDEAKAGSVPDAGALIVRRPRP